MRKIGSVFLVILLALAPSLAQARGGFHGGGFHGGGFHGGGFHGGGFHGGPRGFGGARGGAWHARGMHVGHGGWHGGGWHRGGWNGGYRGWHGRGWGGAPWVGLGLGVLGGLAIGSVYMYNDVCYRVLGYDEYGELITEPFYCY